MVTVGGVGMLSPVTCFVTPEVASGSGAARGLRSRRVAPNGMEQEGAAAAARVRAHVG
jgi:hypothetical protein